MFYAQLLLFTESLHLVWHRAHQPHHIKHEAAPRRQCHILGEHQHAYAVDINPFHLVQSFNLEERLV